MYSIESQLHLSMRYMFKAILWNVRMNESDGQWVMWACVGVSTMVGVCLTTMILSSIQSVSISPSITPCPCPVSLWITVSLSPCHTRDGHFSEQTGVVCHHVAAEMTCCIMFIETKQLWSTLSNLQTDHWLNIESGYWSCLSLSLSTLTALA